MDENRFDTWTQGLSECRGSRRGVARGIAAGLTGLALGLIGHDDAVARSCKPTHEKCDGVCRRRCSSRSQSRCCGGHFPTCCPRHTILNRGCCGPRTRCCKPSREFPQYPNGYCCNKVAGYFCSTTGTPCVRRSALGGLSTDADALGTAPGYS